MERIVDFILDADHLNFVINLFFAVFFTILFLQSGLDKVFDWKGNLDWLKGHFEKSAFGSMVPMLLGILTGLELITGLLGVGGVIGLLFFGNPFLTALTYIFAGLSFLALFLGQRVAKDYAGAASIVPYYVADILAIFCISGSV